MATNAWQTIARMERTTNMISGPDQAILPASTRCLISIEEFIVIFISFLILFT
jgi:hypothetical protein